MSGKRVSSIIVTIRNGKCKRSITGSYYDVAVALAFLNEFLQEEASNNEFSSEGLETIGVGCKQLFDDFERVRIAETSALL